VFTRRRDRVPGKIFLRETKAWLMVEEDKQAGRIEPVVKINKQEQCKVYHLLLQLQLGAVYNRNSSSNEQMRRTRLKIHKHNRN
jgi:hypothetical protein